MFEHVGSTHWHCCTYGKVCTCVRMLGVSVGEVYMDVCEGGVGGTKVHVWQWRHQRANPSNPNMRNNDLRANRMPWQDYTDEAQFGRQLTSVCSHMDGCVLAGFSGSKA